MAPKTLADGKQRVVLLAVKPANPEAPTAAELEAGIIATPRILKNDWRVSATTSNTIDQPTLDAKTNAVAYGASNYEMTVTTIRYFSTTTPGQAADETDTDGLGDAVFQALKEKGATLWVAERDTNKDWDEPFAAGDEVSVYEILLDNPQKPSERDGYIRRTHAPAVRDAWEYGSVAAGV